MLPPCGVGALMSGSTSGGQITPSVVQAACSGLIVRRALAVSACILITRLRHRPAWHQRILGGARQRTREQQDERSQPKRSIEYHARQCRWVESCSAVPGPQHSCIVYSCGAPATAEQDHRGAVVRLHIVCSSFSGHADGEPLGGNNPRNTQPTNHDSQTIADRFARAGARLRHRCASPRHPDSHHRPVSRCQSLLGRQINLFDEVITKLTIAIESKARARLEHPAGG